MKTVIINQDFEQIDSSKIINDASKDLCIFGDSVKNMWIYEYELKPRVRFVFDNNHKKWGTLSYGISIVKPEYIEGATVITALADLAHVVPQIRRLGYEEFYIVCSYDDYVEYYCPEIDFYKKASLDFVWGNKDVKYIHVIPDQKFITPLVYILENGFNMCEHAFLIYNFNRGNHKDEYNVWELYVRLQERYANIAIVDGIFSYDKFIGKRIFAIDKGIQKCAKVIIHGEWLSPYIYKYLFKHLEKIKKRGVLIPWSGKFGYTESTNIFVEGLLKFCNVICLDSESEIGKEIIKDAHLQAKKYFSNGLNYVQPISQPQRVKNNRPKVLVSHSCFSYNRIAEAISIVSKFVGEIEVYCIGSYGDNNLVEETERIGNAIFGQDFHIIKEYMTYEEYVSFLNRMDIAVYAMEDGAGNTTLQILGYTGTKLFFKPKTNTYNYAKDQGYFIYDYYTIPRITLKEFIRNEAREKNYKVSKENFSLEVKIKQWGELFSLGDI